MAKVYILNTVYNVTKMFEAQGDGQYSIGKHYGHANDCAYL